jgi:hypothetical protein
MIWYFIVAVVCLALGFIIGYVARGVDNANCVDSEQSEEGQ